MPATPELLNINQNQMEFPGKNSVKFHKIFKNKSFHMDEDPKNPELDNKLTPKRLSGTF